MNHNLTTGARRRLRRAGRALGLTLILGLLCANSRAQTRPTPAPDFGPNVLIFDPSQPAAAMQSRLDAVYARQDRNQFGPDRYAVLFKPGRYNLDVPVGFYTQVLGLGRAPDDVTISGAVHSDADWLGNGNATCNFWRSCENLGVVPVGPAPLHWAVSQGTSLRRVHIHGDLNLWDRGWSSGGFLADSRIDGQVNSGSQQQWFSRNDDWGGWSGHNWNMVFVGVTRPPSGDWPDPPYTVIAQTPRLREKPYLCIDAGGRYDVVVPARPPHGTVGASWAGGPTPAEAVPLDRFYLAHPDRDNAASLNAALGRGRHLLLTPGVYHLETSLRVTRPGTIVMGLGYATLVPDRGTPALTVADVDGVTVAGLIVDAGPARSPSLVQIGGPGQRRDHSRSPTVLYDLCCRVGGAAAGVADSCLRIDSRDVIVDNAWLWRADHGAGADWADNPCANGLVVDGDDVTVYGLFVEHFQQYQALWNGEGGRVFFYQSELPYDAPSQDAWQHDGVAGYSSYKVAAGVRRHEAWGLGVYGVFTRTDTTCFDAVEAPAAPGVALHHLIAVWITGRPGTEICHLVGGAGPAVNRAHRETTVEAFPSAAVPVGG